MQVRSKARGHLVITHADKVANDANEWGIDDKAITVWTLCFIQNRGAADTVAIRSHNGRYIRASPGFMEGVRLELGPTTIAAHENFKIVSDGNGDGVVSILTYHGTYWRAREAPQPCTPTFCHGEVDLQTHVGDWERFIIEYL